MYKNIAKQEKLLLKNLVDNPHAGPEPGRQRDAVCLRPG